MSTAAKVLVAIAAVLLAILGARWMFAPVGIAAEFGITLDGIVALNTVRGDLGGMFLAAAALCVAGIVRGEGRWLQAVAAVIGSVAIGRSVGLVMDGFSSDALTAIGVEIVMVGVLLWAASQSGAGAARSA